MLTPAQAVLAFIRKHELLKAGDRLAAAVSGGADSVALLRVLLELRHELGIVLSVVHFNHKLRGTESETDERFVTELAGRHELQFDRESADVAQYASEKRLSIETAARDLRYTYFKRLLREGWATRIATGHTLDDQAETVLMRMVRGAGTRGLAGISPRLVVADASTGTPSSSAIPSQPGLAIIRPLLQVRRKELEPYLTSISQVWREDSSNLDLHHSRNRVRLHILPQLEKELNPAVCGALADAAEIARSDEDYWTQQVIRFLPQAWDEPGRTLRLPVVGEFPLALQRRIIRAAADSLGLSLDFRQVEAILDVGSGHACSAELSAGWKVLRIRDELQFTPPEPAPGMAGEYEHRLTVPGSAQLPEIGTRLEALLVSESTGGGYDGKDLLDPGMLATELIARNWRAGDRFWPAHTKAPKKIKELLQEKHITGPGRSVWPVVVSGTEIVWVRGLPTPRHLRPVRGSKHALLIRESPLSEEF